MIIYDGGKWRPLFTKTYIQFSGMPSECSFISGYFSASLEDNSKVIEYTKYLKRKQ